MRPLVFGATLVPLALTASSLSAQAAAETKRAAETITAADVGHHIGVIADDSMMGRNTPSPGLEKTAQYVADQFKKFGLKPLGDNGTWFQRYPIEARRVDFANSRVVFNAGGKQAAAGFTTAARLAAAVLPDTFPITQAVLVAGRHTTASVQKADVSGKVVLYVAPADITPELRGEILNALFQASSGLVILSDLDSAAFAGRVQTALAQPGVRTGPSWAVHVYPGAVNDALAAGGVDLAKARADTTPVVQPLPQLTVGLDVAMRTDAVTAPNTVGLLEGSDPKLKNEYVVMSAHMDHIGIKQGQPDSINNGADDDASGTAGIIELAEAFSQQGARPKRSIIFLTVSGEEKGLLGSDYFAGHPPVPLKQIVADVNFDMIGRGETDSTVLVIGLEHSDLGATFDRIRSSHPELRLSAIPNPPPSRLFSSDHYSFAKRGVPIIKFGGPSHSDYHQVTDSPEKIQAEREVRILRFAFYLTTSVANTDARPQWNPDSYKSIVKEE